MCGIAAFAGATPDLELIAELGELAERRGPDGSGWAVYRDREGWAVERDHTAALSAVPLPEGAGMARLIIGHSRLATDGGADAEGRCQPYAAGEYVVAYNGSLPGVWPHGDTAEITRAVLAGGPRGGLTDFLEQAEALDADRQAVVLGVGRPGEIGAQLWIAQRVGFYGAMPLWVDRRPEGMYLCSRKFPGARELRLLGADGVRCLAAASPAQATPWPLVVSSGATDEERTA